jgi:hypothetical protein
LAPAKKQTLHEGDTAEVVRWDLPPRTGGSQARRNCA